MKSRIETQNVSCQRYLMRMLIDIFTPVVVSSCQVIVFVQFPQLCPSFFKSVLLHTSQLKKNAWICSFFDRGRCVSTRTSWSRCVSTHQRPPCWLIAPFLMTCGKYRERRCRRRRSTWREERSCPKAQGAWGLPWDGVSEWVSVTPFSENITCSD